MEKQPITVHKKWAFVTLGLLVAACVAIISIHSFALGYGFDVGMTISRYVGLSFWSVAAFLIVNLVITFAWIKFAHEAMVKLKLTKLWFAFAVVAALELVMLSVFPIDFYDPEPGVRSAASILHMISSRSMFVMMLVTAMGLVAQVKNIGFRIYTIGYVILGIVMAVLFATGNEWFWSLALPFESSFILGYLVVLCAIPKHPRLSEPKAL